MPWVLLRSRGPIGVIPVAAPVSSPTSKSVCCVAEESSPWRGLLLFTQFRHCFPYTGPKSPVVLSAHSSQIVTLFSCKYRTFLSPRKNQKIGRASCRERE